MVSHSVSGVFSSVFAVLVLRVAGWFRFNVFFTVSCIAGPLNSNSTPVILRIVPPIASNRDPRLIYGVTVDDDTRAMIECDVATAYLVSARVPREDAFLFFGHHRETNRVVAGAGLQFLSQLGQ